MTPSDILDWIFAEQPLRLVAAVSGLCRLADGLRHGGCGQVKALAVCAVAACRILSRRGVDPCEHHLCHAVYEVKR